MIDTSSACSVLALLDADWKPVRVSVRDSGRDYDLRHEVRSLVSRPDSLAAVAVGIGPGSFTGTRVGVAYAVGLAMGRSLPLRTFSSLELASARSSEPAIGLSEAGRGRVYYLEPGGKAGLGEASEVPHALPAWGWLRPATRGALVAAGVRWLDEPELLAVGDAVAEVAGRARTAGYDSVRLEYVQSFGPLGQGRG